MAESFDELVCVQCGYSRRGLPKARSCPECNGDNWSMPTRPLYIGVVITIGMILMLLGTLFIHPMLTMLGPTIVVSSFAIVRRQWKTLGVAISLIASAGAVVFSYYTDGEVGQIFNGFLFCIFIIPFAAGYVAGPGKRAQRSFLGCTLILFLLLVPRQILYGYRWLQLRQEVMLIVDYATTYRTQFGELPTDLSGYTWDDASLQERIGYQASDGRFNVAHYIIQPGISHWYASDTGWGYYPD